MGNFSTHCLFFCTISSRAIVDKLSHLFADGASVGTLCRKSLDELDKMADECGIFGRTKLKFNKAFAVGAGAGSGAAR